MVKNNGRRQEYRQAQVCENVYKHDFLSALNFKMHRMKGRDSDDEHPLPIQTYATLKDRQLKEMLQEHDLPVTGNRSNWEQRHQRYVLSSFLEAGYIQSFMTRWVMLYNSNLDRSSTNRKSRTELRGDLRKWEEEMSRRKKTVIHNVLDYQVIFCVLSFLLHLILAFSADPTKGRVCETGQGRKSEQTTDTVVKINRFGHIDFAVVFIKPHSQQWRTFLASRWNGAQTDGEIVVDESLR